MVDPSRPNPDAFTPTDAHEQARVRAKETVDAFRRNLRAGGSWHLLRGGGTGCIRLTGLAET